MTTVYYKDFPAWSMSYGGTGQTEGFEDQADKTFKFLQKALMLVTPEMPFRGPKEFKEGENLYEFDLLSGDITDGKWEERIVEKGQLTFSQSGIVGIFVSKGPNGKPIYPWNR